MKLLTLDPQTAVTLGWVRTLVADWVASPARFTDPARAAVTLALRAAEFFRNDFPRLAGCVDDADSDPARNPDPFFAAVFSPEDVRGAVDRVSMWADVFGVPVPKEAAVCLAYQMGQHFAGVLLDVVACAALPGVEPEAALRAFLRRLTPAGSGDSGRGEEQLS
jgi:hypothetical protein